MFGTREAFDYFKCDRCDTLQIAEIPGDLARHYQGAEYYSFNNVRRAGLPKRIVKSWVARSIAGKPWRYPMGDGFLDRLYRGAEPWIALVPGLTRNSAICDVGCGEGARLEALAAVGFTSLCGIDPFLPDEKAGRKASGVLLRRGDMRDFSERYDLITMHHSLEHVEAPGEMLDAARERLKPGGYILVRIPVFQSAIWEEYATDWVQIDAPRHLHLFSMAGFIDFASSHGLTCIAHGCDSLGWSLAWSEAYKQGMSMQEPGGKANALPFSAAQLAEFDARARTLNRADQGDQAYFVLTAE